MWICCSSTSPKVLRSGDCGGHLSTVNGHVQETSLRGSDVVNQKTVLLESFINRVGRGQRQYSGWLLCLTNAPLVLRRTKWENIPQTTSFDDSLWTVASVSWTELTGTTPDVVFCCCSASASRINTLCVYRCFSAYLGCNQWLFELLLTYFQL